MKATMPNSLSAVGSLSKDNEPTTLRSRWPALHLALDSYPHHAFSPEGRRNVCRRFGITDGQLEATLLVYQRPGDYASEAECRAADLARVLGAIEAVVNPAPKRKASPKGKRKGGAVC